MIIQLEKNITDIQRATLEAKLNAIQYKTMEVSTQFGEYIIGVGKKEFDIRSIGTMAGIRDIHRVSDAYKLVSKKWKVDDTVIDLGDGLKIGGGHFAMMAGPCMAGPCSIESEEQIDKTINHLVENGIRIMRGGVYKPRSSPYSFRGLGIDGLKLWYKKASEAGIKIITEVMMSEQIDAMLEYVDIFQVGARNSQNFNLLDALGKTDKTVMLKRGISGTIDELLQSAEYIFSNGNERILLCERGIRTYEKAYRNCMECSKRRHICLSLPTLRMVLVYVDLSKMSLWQVLWQELMVLFLRHTNVPKRLFPTDNKPLILMKPMPYLPN